MRVISSELPRLGEMHAALGLADEAMPYTLVDIRGHTLVTLRPRGRICETLLLAPAGTVQLRLWCAGRMQDHTVLVLRLQTPCGSCYYSGAAPLPPWDASKCRAVLELVPPRGWREGHAPLALPVTVGLAPGGGAGSAG